MRLTYFILLKSLSAKQSSNSWSRRSANVFSQFHSSSYLQQDTTSESNQSMVLVERYNAVTLIGLNRANKRNALNSTMITELRKELKIFESDPTSYVAVLYGTGGNFCAGLDMVEMTSCRTSLPLVDEFCCKPVIASLNGYAVAEGFDLAMACDARIMDDRAILGSFSRRFGVPISESALQRLSHSAGFSFAMDVILTGRPIKADEAYQRGLVQLVTPCGASKGNAITYAQSLCKFPQEALRADRANLIKTLKLSSEEQNAINVEIKHSLPAAFERMHTECQRFSDGVGKHGTFKGLTAQSGWPEWMK